MNTTKDKTDPFGLLADAFTKELISMPDSEVLEGLDANAVKLDGLRMLANAKAKAGQQRLAAARAAMEARTRVSSTSGVIVSVSEARAYLQSAANDPRYTLAARELSVLSDDEVLRLYRQAKHLKEQADKNEAEDK